MANDSEQSPGEPRQFRKNRFFDGKLMTARDMELEQRYHADRLETLTRQTTGSGVLSGLEITSVRTVDDRLSVTLDAGIAIDPLGRPIIVETPTTKSLSEPDGDECYLFVRFDEVETDAVAVPDADRRHPEAAAGRVVEVFELTYRDSPPERAVPSVGLPENIGAASTARDVADRIAAAYDREPAHNRSSQPSDPAVYLGGFERTADGSWKPIDSARPHYVYDNDLLYATLLEHITDTENPHQTELEPNEQPEELDSIHDRVEYLHSELSALKERQATTTTHLLGKTLASAGRLFATAADRFVDHHAEVSTLAREISQRVGDASHSAAADDAEEFCSLVRQLQPSLVELGDRLDGAAHQQTADRYFDALADLQSALEADESAVETAIAFDAVAEAAVDLKVAYPAHAER